MNTIRKVILTCARAILPVYRTTPTPILFREAGLLPPEIELDKRCRKAILRAHRLDARHPLRRRVRWSKTQNRNTSRLSRRAIEFPETEYIDPLINPPWIPQEGWSKNIKRVTRPPFPIPNQIPFQDIVIYSDASCSDSPSGSRVGGGFVIHQAGQVISRKCMPLSPVLSIFDAEVTTVAIAIEIALNLETSRFANDLWILIDNQDVARQLLSTPVCSSQEAFIRFSKHALAWPTRPRLPHTLKGKVRIQWIPSHSNIQGNCDADYAAKEVLQNTYHNPSPYVKAFFWAKEKIDTEISDYWSLHASNSYRALGIDGFERCPGELKLPRSLVAHIYAARSGHGDFANYHERFHHWNALNTCSCGSPKSSNHMILCNKPKVKLPSVPKNIAEPAKNFIGTSNGATRMVKWLKETKFFTEICPRHSSNISHRASQRTASDQGF